MPNKASPHQHLAPTLSPDDQRAYLDLLLRGASPAAACQQLQLDLFRVVEAIAEDDEFRLLVDAVYDALSQNVAARLYQEAMKGNVTAMTQWLKHRLPPEWVSGRTNEDWTSWETLSHEELLELARVEQIEIPTELESGFEASGSQSPPPAISRTDSR